MGTLKVSTKAGQLQAAEGTQPHLPFAAAKDPGISDFPGGQIGPGSAASILVLAAHEASRRWGQGGMDMAASLDAGLLVRGEDAVRWGQGSRAPRRRTARSWRG